MHQIWFRLGLCPRHRTGAAHSAPSNPQLDLNGPTSKDREGEGGQGSGGEGRVFYLYLSIRGLQKGPGKFLMGVMESPGFFVTKTVGTLFVKMCISCLLQQHFTLCVVKSYNSNVFILLFNSRWLSCEIFFSFSSVSTYIFSVSVFKIFFRFSLFFKFQFQFLFPFPFQLNH